MGLGVPGNPFNTLSDTMAGPLDFLEGSACPLDGECTMKTFRHYHKVYRSGGCPKNVDPAGAIQRLKFPGVLHTVKTLLPRR